MITGTIAYIVFSVLVTFIVLNFLGHGKREDKRRSRACRMAKRRTAEARKASENKTFVVND